MTTTRRASLAPLRVGMRTRGLLLWRRLQSERSRGDGRVIGFLAVGVGLGAVIFGAGFFGGFYVVHKSAPELLRSGTAFFLLGLMAALVLSSLGHAAQAFFSARDLWLWDSAPAPPRQRFTDRLAETALAALPTTLLLGVLALSGVVLGGGLGALGAARAVVAVLLVGVVPLSIGVSLAHVGGALLPAGKLRRVSLLVLGVAVAAALVWFRRMRIEKALSPEGAAELLQSARAVKSVGPDVLPHALGARFVVDGDLIGLVGLVGWVALFVAVAYLAFVALSKRARDLAVDESPLGMLRGSLQERALKAALRPLSSELRPVVEKDLLAFVRDPAQWGQVVLLLGVGVLYLVNADALRQGFAQLPDVGKAVLPAMHTGLVCFISAGLSVRFGFPQLGLEGPAVWIVDGSPLPARRLLIAKWVSSLPIVVIFPTVVGVVGGLVLGFNIEVWALTTIVIVVVALGLAAFSVGRGALQPLFDATSLSELAIGPGALSSMLWTTAQAFAASVGALLVGSGDWLVRAVDRDIAWRTEVGAALIAVGAIVPCLVVALLGRRALVVGADAFVKRRESEATREFLERAAPVEQPLLVDE